MTHVPAVPPHRVPCVTLELRAHCHPRGTVGVLGTHQPLGPLSWWGHSSHPAVPKTPRPAVPCHQTVSLSGDPPPCFFLPLSPHHIPPSPQLGRLSPGPSGCHRGSSFLALPSSAPRYRGVSPGPEPSHRLLRHVPLATPRRGFSASSRLPGRCFGEVLWGVGAQTPLQLPALRRPPRPGQGTCFN